MLETARLAVINLFVILVCASCVQSTETISAVQRLREQENVEFAEVIGSWQVVCYRKTRTVTGQLTGTNACYLSQGSGYYPLATATIRQLLITASGGRIRVEQPGERSWDTEACGGNPRNHGVDGVSLNSMSQEQQVRAILSGNVYGKEYQASWPSCTILIGKTELQGIIEAYDVFRQAAIRLNYL